MTKLTEERIKELATAQRGPRGELIWPDFPINFARAIEAVLQPVQEPVAWMAAAYRKFINKETDHLPIGVQVSLVDMGWPNQIPLYTAPPDQTAEIERLKSLCERMKQEAQIHAQEARTANATIAEIYQCVSGSTGEPGNWHGAEPVRNRIVTLKAEIERLNSALQGSIICDREKNLRIATLEAALRAAKEMVESWGAYASPYFQERHDLVGDIAILSKALGEE